jgi:hypothetical protein
MGMYDYLGGEQIKVFYSPIFEEEDIITGKPTTWHSGGGLRSFGENDELPLQTLYYKYPLNFCIFDYRGFTDVFIIKDGKFKEIKKYYNLKKSDLGDAIYSYYGQEINVKTLKDFKEIKDDFVRTLEVYEKGRNELFPDGFFNTLKENRELFDSKEGELNSLRERTHGEFSKKWICNDEYRLEKQFGEFIECYIFLKSCKDGDIYSWSNPMLRYLDCKKAVKDFISNNDGIVEKYHKWVDNEELVDLKTLEMLVKDIFEDPTPEEIERSKKESEYDN